MSGTLRRDFHFPPGSVLAVGLEHVLDVGESLSRQDVRDLEIFLGGVVHRVRCIGWDEHRVARTDLVSDALDRDDTSPMSNSRP